MKRARRDLEEIRLKITLNENDIVLNGNGALITNLKQIIITLGNAVKLR